MHLKSLLAAVAILMSNQLVAAENKGLGEVFNSAPMQVCMLDGNKGTVGCAVPRATNQDTKEDSVSASLAGGNPINLLTGNKFERATDIQISGGEYALSLNRYYNSRSTQRGLLGIGWRHDYEMQLQDTNDQINILQADGRKIDFVKTAAALGNSTLFVTRYAASKPELGYLERTQSTDPNKAAWIWILPTGKQFEFVVHKQTSITNNQGLQRFGQLSRVTERPNDPNSPYWSLTYGTDGKLAQVDNHLGDRLKFGYHTTKSGLPRITITSSTPNKNKSTNSAQSATWYYLLDQNNNLAQVVSPTGDRTGYAYKDPNDKHNLTAKYRYDDKGAAQLITEWKYDAYDRAISSSHDNGVEKVSVAFDPDTVIPMPANHIFTNTITNSVGEKTDYRYRFIEGDVQLISVRGAGCATCGPANISYEYDSAGRVIKTSQLDDKGQVVSSTAKELDSLGRVSRRTTSDESLPVQSVINYEYVSDDPKDYRFALIAKEWQNSVATAQQTGTSYVYDKYGQLIEKKEFGYTPAGRAISRTHLMSYDDKGNLSQVALRDDNSLNSKPIVMEAYTWFDNGSIKTSARPNIGEITTFEHNADGLTTAIERKNNQETSTIKIEYGHNQLPMSVSRYLNEELLNGVKYQRNNNGDITTVHDLQDNFIASYAYDDAGRNLGELTPKRAMFSHLDTEGRRLVGYSISNDSVDKLSYTYDAKNRITGVGRDETQLVGVNYSNDNEAAEIIGASGKHILMQESGSESNDYAIPNTWDALGIKKLLLSR